MWGARPEPELCSSGCCCCPSGSRRRQVSGRLASRSCPLDSWRRRFYGLKISWIRGTGLLGLGGITTGGCFHGRSFFLGSGAGGRGSGLWGVSGTTAPFARLGTGTEPALLRDLDEILFEIGIFLPLLVLAATAGAVSAEGALDLDRATGEPAGSDAVSVATRAVSATPLPALCKDCLQGG